MTALITLPICLSTLIILVGTYIKNIKHLWYQSEFVLMLLIMLWINIGQLGFAIFFKYHGIVPGDWDFGTYCLYNLTYNIVLISPCTTWIFSWKNFNSVSSLLNDAKVLKIATNLVFWLFLFVLLVLYFTSCCMSAYADVYTLNNPLQYKRYGQLAFTAANIAQAAFNFGFACNFISLAVMCGTIFQLRRVVKQFEQSSVQMNYPVVAVHMLLVTVQSVSNVCYSLPIEDLNILYNW